MDLEFKDPFLLAKILEIARKGSVVDCLLVFSDKKISTQSMDSSHISMINLHLDVTEVCTTYNFHSNSPIKAGINVEHYLKVMKLLNGKKNVSLKLSLNSNNMDVLVFSAKADKNIFNFDLRLMEIDVKEIPIPPCDDFAQISFPIKQISELINPIDCAAMEIGVSVDEPNSLLYKAESDTGTLFGKITGGESSGRPQKIVHKVSLSYLKTYCGVPPDLAPKVNFFFQLEFPLLIKYEFGENSYLEMYVAPKIDDDI
jgi:proliferating cell nuclear antigen PCNA